MAGAEEWARVLSVLRKSKAFTTGGTEEHKVNLRFTLCSSVSSVVKDFEMSAPETNSARDGWVYAIAALAGIATGAADIFVDDLLFTALIALASCMVLGMLRPVRPWRWVVAMAVFIPLTELAGHLAGIAQPTRAQIYGCFLAALPGVAGAYGGSVVRAVVENLRQGK